MKFSECFLPTIREVPKDAEAISHQLMLKSGMIRRLASGLYSYLPLGFKTLLKVIAIVREEMDKSGAQELLLPAIHPEELWQKTGRLSTLGEDMIQFKNRAGKNMILGPTHEEVITWLVSGEVESYRQLPLILYQIQTKFRDEPRPRFGVIRTCEFIMKDAYSFNASWESLDDSYKKIYQAYCNIFERCGLNYLSVEADPGIMGGDVSHEFMAPSEYGEDRVVLCSGCNYAASLDVARRKEGVVRKEEIREDSIKEVYTPGISSIADVSRALGVSIGKLLKTIIYRYDTGFIAVVVRGESDVNEAKLRKKLKSSELRMATASEIKSETGADMGFSGPLGLKLRIIADFDVRGISGAAAGANKKDYHLINLSEGKDFKIDEFCDIRNVKESDLCPECGKALKIQSAIEIGHIFKLGNRYSKPLEALFVDGKGKSSEIIMGCYGIGINRIAASFIEQNNDAKGIIWNSALAPYKVIIIATNIDDEEIFRKSKEIYKFLKESGLEVIFDDRTIRAGNKFNDADLIGIPYQIVVGSNYIKEGKFELRKRGQEVSLELENLDQILDNLK
ncbi:MAG: proline--tRNA ligase [Candidatus Kaelpia aquatica]|nr:proline--tRNA ligase [Candidatus Kaelpia aquatica]